MVSFHAYGKKPAQYDVLNRAIPQKTLSDREMRNLFALLEKALSPPPSPRSCHWPATAPICSFKAACDEVSQPLRAPYFFISPSGVPVMHPSYAYFTQAALDCGLRPGGPLRAKPINDDYAKWLLETKDDPQKKKIVEDFTYRFASKLMDSSSSSGWKDGAFFSDNQGYYHYLWEHEPLYATLDEASKATYFKGMNALYQRILKPQSSAINMNKIPSGLFKQGLEDPYLNPAILQAKGAVGDRARTSIEKNKKYFQEKTKTIQENLVKVIRSRQQRFAPGSVEFKAAENMVTRVQTIIVNFAPTDEEFEGHCRAGPNAFYDGTKHQFTVCPSILGMAPGMLLRVAAHEMAHAIAPCMVTGKLYGNVKDSSSGYLVNPGWYETPPPKGSTVAEDGIPLSSNPFGTSLECLQKTAGVRNSTLEFLQESRRKLVALKKQEAADGMEITRINVEISGLDSNIKKAMTPRPGKGTLFEEFPQCDIFGGQMEESFADLLSAEAIGLTVAAQGNASGTDSFFDYTFLSECPFGQAWKTGFSQLSDALKELGCLPPPVPREFDEHMDEGQRMDLILLRNRQLSQQIGCEASGESCVDQ